MNENGIDNLLRNKELTKQESIAYNEQIKKACIEVFSSPNGIIVGKYLYQLSLNADLNNDLNPSKLIYYKAQKDNYNQLRQYLPLKVIADIELYGE